MLRLSIIFKTVVKWECKRFWRRAARFSGE